MSCEPATFGVLEGVVLGLVFVLLFGLAFLAQHLGEKTAKELFPGKE